MTKEQLEMLERLAKLKQDGLLNEEEFQSQKTNILKTATTPISQESGTISTSVDTASVPTDRGESKTSQTKPNDIKSVPKEEEKKSAIRKILRNGIPLLIILALFPIAVILFPEGMSAIIYSFQYFLVRQMNVILTLLTLGIIFVLIYFVRKNQNIKNFIGATFLILGLVFLVFSFNQFHSYKDYDPLISGYYGYDNIRDKRDSALIAGILSALSCVTGITMLMMKAKKKPQK